MEDLDAMILQNLRALKCDTEGISSLSELKSDLVVEAVVRCLWLISPQVPISSYRLPPSMTARFRLASTIASAIEALGYKDKIGYQTFLYGSEVEVRRLLLFLIEKLPKEVDQTTGELDYTPLERLKKQAAIAIKRQLSDCWIPWYCRRLGYVSNGRFWQPPMESPETIHFNSCSLRIQPVDDIHQLFTETNGRDRDIPASILDFCGGSVTWKDAETVKSGEAELAKFLSNATFSRQQQRSAKPRLLPKPIVSIKPPISAKPRGLSSEAKSPPISTEPKISEAENQGLTEVQELKNAIEKLSNEASTLEESLGEWERNQSTLSITAGELQTAKVTLEVEVGRRQKSVELLPNYTEVVEKLEDFVGGSNTRMDLLQSQWYEVKRPLEEELKELELTKGYKSEPQRMREEVVQMQQNISDAEAETQMKTRMIAKLQKELDAMEQQINRSYFTKRILEIVANIRKQRDQIEKIISDTREAQRDIASLSGKLERTFIATDELIFKDAKQNETVRRVYKQIVSLHEMCGEMIKSVETTGEIRREIREVEDLIDSDKSRSLTVNLEKLLNDFFQMKQENEVLLQRVQQLQS